MQRNLLKSHEENFYRLHVFANCLSTLPILFLCILFWVCQHHCKWLPTRRRFRNDRPYCMSSEILSSFSHALAGTHCSIQSKVVTYDRHDGGMRQRMSHSQWLFYTNVHNSLGSTTSFISRYPPITSSCLWPLYGTKWPFMCWCAIKNLLAHSLIHPLLCNLRRSAIRKLTNRLLELQNWILNMNAFQLKVNHRRMCVFAYGHISFCAAVTLSLSQWPWYTGSI